MIIGIDLGTTNSLVSAWTDEGIKMIKNSLGEYLTPSVVSIESNGDTFVGQIAKERLITHPETTFQEFKRNMGSDVTYKAFGRTYTATDLSAIVLRELKQDAERELGQEVTEAIISVPAYFSDSQRAATRNAGIIAGLKVSRLVNEPSAAALYYHVSHINEDEKYIVFDFGGGTLDVTLVDAFENIIEIQGISGDNHLGGADFNEAIALDICNKNDLIWPALTDYQKALIYHHAEIIKIRLSTESELEYKFRFSRNKEDLFAKEIVYRIDLQHLVDISADIYEKIKRVMIRLFNDAGMTKDDIDDVAGIILVGGSSKMPAVKLFLRSMYGGKLLVDENPDEIVCKGVGVAAGIQQRSGNVKDLILTDICPFTLGVGIVNDVMSPIIHKNEILPCSRTETYQTIKDMQDTITFSVYQGEYRTASKNKLLDKVSLKVEPLPAGEATVDVTFSYDINGIFEIEFESKYMDESVVKDIAQSSGLSEADLAARRNKLAELKSKSKENRNKLSLLMEKADKLFAESNMEQRIILGNAMEYYQRALRNANADAIEASKQNLENTIEIIERSIYGLPHPDI